MDKRVYNDLTYYTHHCHRILANNRLYFLYDYTIINENMSLNATHDLLMMYKSF